MIDGGRFLDLRDDGLLLGIKHWDWLRRGAWIEAIVTILQQSAKMTRVKIVKPLQDPKTQSTHYLVLDRSSKSRSSSLKAGLMLTILFQERSLETKDNSPVFYHFHFWSSQLLFFFNRLQTNNFWGFWDWSTTYEEVQTFSLAYLLLSFLQRVHFKISTQSASHLVIFSFCTQQFINSTQALKWTGPVFLPFCMSLRLEHNLHTIFCSFWCNLLSVVAEITLTSIYL